MEKNILELYENGTLSSLNAYEKEDLVKLMSSVLDSRLYEEALREYDWTLTELDEPFLNSIRKGRFSLIRLFAIYTEHSDYNYGNAIFTCLEYSSDPEMLKYITELAYKAYVKQVQEQYTKICETPADAANDILELAKSIGYTMRADLHRELAEQRCAMLPPAIQRELGADKVKAVLDTLE